MVAPQHVHLVAFLNVVELLALLHLVNDTVIFIFRHTANGNYLKSQELTKLVGNIEADIIVWLGIAF